MSVKKFVVLLVFSLVKSSIYAAIETPSCEDANPDYELASATGHLYRFNSRAEKWDTARSICQHEGADLAVINSEAEAQALVAIFRRHPVGTINCHDEEYCSSSAVALGVVFSDKNQQYLTIHGESLNKAGYNSWWFQSREGHGYMIFNGKLTDFNGTLYSTAFICEKNC